MSEADPIEQFDPRLKAVQGEPWFEAAAAAVENAANAMTGHGFTECTVFAGAGRLTLGDPLAGALVEVTAMPAEGLVFVVLKVPEPDGLLDSGKVLADLSERIRAVNPNGWLLTLPAEWSFRTMLPEMAREFARNMIAFVSDGELARIGLRRIEP